MNLIKKILCLSFLSLVLSTAFYSITSAKSEVDDRYPIPIKSSYSSLIGKLDTSSNIFNNKEKQKLFKKVAKHFETFTIADGHYVFRPNDDGFHGSRGMQWVIDADFNNNIIMICLLVQTSTTRLQGPVGVYQIYITTPYGNNYFNIPNTETSYSRRSGYSDEGFIKPITPGNDKNMATTLTFMLKTEPEQTYWVGYGRYQNVSNHFSKSDIKGMKDTVELFEVITM